MSNDPSPFPRELRFLVNCGVLRKALKGPTISDDDYWAAVDLSQSELLALFIDILQSDSLEKDVDHLSIHVDEQ